MAERVVLLHGFGGTRRAWEGVQARLDPERYMPLALDLPGHGGAAQQAEPITFAGTVARVLSEAPDRFILCGYSLGGRVALGVALAAPERTERLLLVSCSPGIEDPSERARRRAADRRLAEDLERMPFERFIERWRSQQLFAGEPEEVGELARADHRRNSPPALAAALRGLGTGEMEPLWDRLPELSMPVQILVGERDRKFQALGRLMLARLPRGQIEVLPGGHALALESPAALARAIATGPQPPRSPRAP